MEEIDRVINEIQVLYEKDKLTEAYDLIKNSGFTEEFIGNRQVLRQVCEDYEETRRILLKFEDKEDWISEREGQVHIKYKKIPNAPTISIMCETIVDVPLFDFIALVYETDMYPNWVPFCERSEIVHHKSRSRKVVYAEFDVLKVAKRAVAIEGYGFNMLNTDGVVMIVCKSLDEYSNTSMTLAKVNFFGCLITPLTETRVHVRLINNFDPNVMFMPYSLLNWVVRKTASLIISKLNKEAKSLQDSGFSKKNSHGNAEFYQHLQESLQEYFLNSNKILA